MHCCPWLVTYIHKKFRNDCFKTVDEKGVTHKCYKPTSLAKLFRQVTNRLVCTVYTDLKILPILMPTDCGACLKNSPLWKNFKVFNLREIMCICHGGLDEKSERYAEWFLQLGNGLLPNVDRAIDLPLELCIPLDLSALNELTSTNLLHNCNKLSEPF